MGERLHFFSEPLIESEHSDGIFFDQERAWVSWNEGDSFYMRLGMDDYLSKPINRLELKRVLDKFLPWKS